MICKLCPLAEKIISAVKQYNGIKETNTATGRDKEWQNKKNKTKKKKKKKKKTDWSQCSESVCTSSG